MGAWCIKCSAFPAIQRTRTLRSCLLDYRNPRSTKQQRLGCIRRILSEIRQSTRDPPLAEGLLHSQFQDTIRDICDQRSHVADHVVARVAELILEIDDAVFWQPFVASNCLQQADRDVGRSATFDRRENEWTATAIGDLPSGPARLVARWGGVELADPADGEPIDRRLRELPGLSFLSGSRELLSSPSPRQSKSRPANRFVWTPGE
jgi:hypothetical protein